MATLLETFSTETAARRAVDQLRAAGVPARDIRLMIGTRRHDVRNEPVGGFVGAVPPDAPVGTYADGRVSRWRGRGSFIGDPDGRRQGTFADVDRTVVVSFEDGAEHAHVTGLAALRRLLRRGGLDDALVGRALQGVRDGRVIVLAEVPGTQAA